MLLLIVVLLRKLDLYIFFVFELLRFFRTTLLLSVAYGNIFLVFVDVTFEI